MSSHSGSGSRLFDADFGYYHHSGAKFFVHFAEPQAYQVRRTRKVSLIIEIKHYMKNHLYSLAMLISIVTWCVSTYLLLAKAPSVGGIDVPRHGAHTLMFFGLAFMTTCSQRKPKVILTLAILFMFGALTEVAQHFSPPRTCDLLDFIEDAVGSTLGVVAAIVWMNLLRRFLRSSLWLRVTKRDLATTHP